LTRKPAYLTKDVAARISGRSQRRLLEMAAKGQITKLIVPDHNNNDRPIAVFLQSDIEALAKIPFGGRRAFAAMQPGTAATPVVEGNRSIAIIRPKPSGVPALPQTGAVRLWLTLAEAADYTGLPESWLAARIAAGKLPALDVGVRPGGRHRVSRKDLDAISAQT